MRNKVLIITSLLLVISIGNYSRLIFNGNVRTVEFLSILAIGILTGVLLTELFKVLRDKKDSKG